jgi:secondary thiamine-phosphate synthase enzyme
MTTRPTEKPRFTLQQRPTAALQLYLETLIYTSSANLELINITHDLNGLVRKHGLKAGYVIVQSMHATTAVFINEFQQAFVDDMKSLLGRLVGRLDFWRRNDSDHSAFDEKSTASRLRSMVLGHTLSVPVHNGELQLGDWQSVILAELDGPRERLIQIQVVGFPGELS